MLSVEIATIYKREGRTRKVHHLIYVPHFEAARTLTRELAKVGNLASDGRPILGLDSRDLLEMTLDSDPGSYLVPAHIWTPWFSALGSKSGFDTVADCYADLSEHIFAVETGLSSDPPMNYRLETLDRYRLVSNSDAHSPPMLGREATAFGTELDYYAIRDALRTGQGDVETVEFFPEEGKYHLDGHRKCGLRLRPAQTREQAGHRCPSCGKPLTVGVLHRVEELADRPDGFHPQRADGFCNLVPLPEIVSEIRGVGSKSKAVGNAVAALTAELGPEITILRDAPLAEVSRAGSPLLAEAVGRLRRGEVVREAGYDGEYGAVRLFGPDEIRRFGSVPTAPALFEVANRPAGAAPISLEATVRAGTLNVADIRTTGTQSGRNPPAEGSAEGSAEAGAAHSPSAGAPGAAPAAGAESRDGAATALDTDPATAALDGSLLGGLDSEQRAAASATEGPLLIAAGPGTGKTRTLTHRMAYLISCGVPPDRCLAVTFTRRAREEMRDRLTVLLGSTAAQVTVTTFHGLGTKILREHHALAGLAGDFRIADEAERRAVAEELTGSAREGERLLAETSGQRRVGEDLERALRARGLVDFDDLVALPVELLTSRPEVAAAYRERYPWICVDEYQDVDEQQYHLLRLLSATASNLCVIGDPDQAIYGFRGANVEFFLRFQQDYPTARSAALTTNYRSSPAIVTGAVQAVRPATLIPRRTLVPARRAAGGANIGLHACPDEHAEAEHVAATVDRLLGGSSFHSLDSGRVDSDGADGVSFGDIAILYRTEATSRPVAEALTRAGMPFQKRSHDRLANRPGVAEVVRELRHTGTLALREAAENAVASLTPAGPATAAAAETDGRAADIRAAAELLTPLAERCDGELHRFLSELALGAEADAWDPRADRISLLTVHAAKGLEWPVVFLVGCEDGLLPLRWPGEPERTDLAEERRLFFVAMTRARSHLFLSHAGSRERYGTRRQTTPSPFLDAIGEALVERLGEGAARRRPRDRQLRLL